MYGKGLWGVLAGMLTVSVLSGPVGNSSLNQLAQALGNGQVDAQGKVVIDGGMRTSMESAFEQYMRTSGESDANAVINNVMQGALASAEAEASGIAQHVQSNQNAKKGKHEEIAELRDIITEGRYPADHTYSDEKCNEVAVRLGSKKEAVTLLQNQESMLQTITDTSSQLQLQLQDAMNQQQQAIQILSNIMKNQHDTLKAIIRNMR